jgi:FAD/FMN-containing dehydrogenase
MSLLAELRAALGDGAVLEADTIGARSTSDMSYTGNAPPRALLRPRSTAEVSAALRLCHAAGVPVVAQGGMTGLAGGANPNGTEIAISLERLRGIEEVDTASATMVVKAGTPLEECQQAAAENGLFLALLLPGRRQSFHERRRHTRHPLRHGARAGAGVGGGAGRRYHPLLHEPHAEEQCGL